jgi:excisionase family DNA binding protein
MKSNKKLSDPTSMYMTVEQAAKELQIGRTLAYRLADEYLATNGLSGMPVKRVGRLLRVRRSDLEARSHVTAEHRTAVEPAIHPAMAAIANSPVSKARIRRSASTVEQPALPFST